MPDMSSLGREVVFLDWNSYGGRADNFAADLIAAGVAPG